MLQLHPSFNVKALEALVTLVVVDLAINEVKEEVAAPKATSTDKGKAIVPTEGPRTSSSW